MTDSLKQTETEAIPVEPMQFSEGATPACAQKPVAAQMKCSPGEARPLLPYPNGWFAACFSHELKSGSVLTRPLMDREIVLYRTRSGIARVIEPYCPHMAAHLGHGGRVEGEDLVCPFHHLAFGPEGGCVRTGHGGVAPRIALTGRHMRERNGVIFVWVHHDGLAPSWEPPAHDLSGWSPPAYIHSEQGGYVQTSGENSADLLHFDAVHKFRQPEMSARVVDNLLEINLSAKLIGRQLFLHMKNYDASNVYAHFTMPSLGLEAGVQAYSTPDAPLRWSFRTVTALKVERFGRLPATLRSALYAMMTPLGKLWVHHTLNQDRQIWAHRSYPPRPNLTADDRTFAIYLRWVSQFYSETGNTGA